MLKTCDRNTKLGLLDHAISGSRDYGITLKNKSFNKLIKTYIIIKFKIYLDIKKKFKTK